MLLVCPNLRLSNTQLIKPRPTPPGKPNMVCPMKQAELSAIHRRLPKLKDLEPKGAKVRLMYRLFVTRKALTRQHPQNFALTCDRGSINPPANKETPPLQTLMLPNILPTVVRTFRPERNLLIFVRPWFPIYRPLVRGDPWQQLAVSSLWVDMARTGPLAMVEALIHLARKLNPWQSYPPRPLLLKPPSVKAAPLQCLCR